VPATPTSRRIAIVAALGLGLTALAISALRVGFLNDDYLFIEQARSGSLWNALSRPDALGNYYRPLSRQIYFALIGALSHGSPLVFHVVNFVVFLAVLALLADLLLAVLPPIAALAGVLYFAVIPFQRVAWLWISCDQDLLALGFALGALALYRRSRMVPALALYLGALASKESVLMLPLMLGAWEVLIARRTPAEAARRAAPFAALALVWGAFALSVSLHGQGARLLHFDPTSFLAAWVHEVQSLIGLDHPPGFPAAWIARGPDPLALILLSAAALWLPDGKPAGGPAAPAAKFAALWLIAAGFVTGPLAWSWSSYFYMTSAVGAALLFGLAARRLGRWGWPVLVGGLLWWHAGGTAVRSFAVEDRPWGWTSHLTSYYFERASALTDSMSRQLRSLESAPPHGTRFFFATLPPWAGFQMGSGALVRNLYRDPSLESWFYSQYSETTAADHPCRYFYWDGRTLKTLYARAGDPSFQVGCDLLLLDRPAGAAHAFGRGLMLGGDRADLLYWLGWAELMRGRRAEAEAAWLEFGARDDSLHWAMAIVDANHALAAGDSVAARRHLAAAISKGVGRPIAHAVLGELLLPSQPKYGMLELSVAVWLNPADLRTRRLLVAGLTRARLDQAALRHLDEIEAHDPAWRSDAELARLDDEVRHRTGGVP